MVRPPASALWLGLALLASIRRLSDDLPLVVEIVDTEDKIKAFLPILDPMMSSGLITLEKVQVLQYGQDTKHAPA